ncbi:phosphatase PAP2 family protein [Pseudomonas huanghezhanensis]|uniref:phosphatase PAP2 family protein n=1 Tax=Pseudomonas huanghezhanensis TaxID=3002903 RepID=UPI0022861C1B|nr:phosphatase PAP2 family protein [Pseudomonas sp. BSw22131]
MNHTRYRFYLINIGIPLLIALGLFLAFDLTNLDVLISDALYNTTTHEFVLGHNKLFENFTHRWARIIPNWTGEAAMIGAFLSFVWPLFRADKHASIIAWMERTRVAQFLQFLTRHRRDLLFVVVSFAVTTGFIHYFKSHTSVFCPVETTLYGGIEEKREWFENFNLLHEAGKGRCWPGGHASGGFTMMALYFVALRYRWRHAKAVLVATLLLGFFYGTTRIFQGWHFMSHTPWAGVIVWFSMFFTAMAFYGRARLDPDYVAPDRARTAPATT